VGELSDLPARARVRMLRAMFESVADSEPVPHEAGVAVPAEPPGLAQPDMAVAALPTVAGKTALAAAQALARNAAASATLRAYKADWRHFADWCAAQGFVPVPAAPAIVGAYLADLAESYAPSTIRRRLAALGKMHRFNDLPWNPAHRDILGPL
jgi:hypothetical protein